VALSDADINNISRALKHKNSTYSKAVELTPQEAQSQESLPYRERVVSELRQKQKTLCSEELDQIIAGYRNGQNLHELVEQFGSNRATLSKKIKSAGVTLRHIPPSEGQIDEMVKLYESRLSLSKVGKQFGFSASSVLLYLSRRGIKTRNSHGN
jgi:transposase